VKLTFLGTRGYIEPRSRRHRMHTATLVTYRGRRVLIDCGESWRGRLGGIAPHAVVLTHAHPDHAFGLDADTPCPVHATRATWQGLGERVPAALRRRLRPRRRRRIEGMIFEPFPVEHSLRAPAVGYRIEAGRVVLFYVPDVLRIRARARAFAGIRLYVGDGATLVRPLARRDRESGRPFGHASVRTQLAWCAAEGVPEMIVTHCGSGIVAGEPRQVAARVRRLARESGVRVTVAHDGMARVVR
jgi:phosphoribosyl 1,2-cyclic phosphodiesterase